VCVAASPDAAEAGAAALAAGGNAVDAAVATAFALSVVDPGNAGLGGYGGFLVHAPPDAPPVCVDFNTWVPARLNSRTFRLPGDRAQLLDGGRSVAPPMVVQGLAAAREQLGTLPLADLVQPAVRLAREGFPVGRDLADALAEHWQRTGGGRPEFAAIFFPAGRPPSGGEVLVQTALAETLEAIEADGAEPFRTGAVAASICRTARADGGFLEPDDLARGMPASGATAATTFAGAEIHGPPRETSGAGVLFDALESIEPSRLEENRSPRWAAELARVLGAAWQARAEAARAAAAARHTSTLAAADGEGGVAALTFTHGSLFFGSGLIAGGTGVVLNAGANLFAATVCGPRAVTNMSPVVVAAPRRACHAIGGTGGPRIPGILLTALVDVLHHGRSLPDALAAPHLSVRALDGVVEVERELLHVVSDSVELQRSDYGPAFGVTRTGGELLAAVDPRFDSGAAFAS
jgi:gamma-glutamyltranspeptidase / glutathione hydrolase